MSRQKSARRKSFLAALMLCMVSALGLTAGVVYDKTHNKDKMDIADLNEPISETQEMQDVNAEVEKEETTQELISEEETQEQFVLDREVYDETAEEVTEEITETDTEAINEIETEEDTQAASEAAQAVSGTVNALHFNSEEKILWPIKGDVILPYSMEDTILFPTLNVYKCNDAMMIKGDKDMPVCAAQEGVVESVETDREFGNIVVINMGDDYKAVYGQLKDVSVKKDDSIEKGQQIAVLGAPTPYYEEEGYNLYFKIKKGDKTVDPSGLLE